jgi:hypothetical protein
VLSLRITFIIGDFNVSICAKRIEDVKRNTKAKNDFIIISVDNSQAKIKKLKC